MTLARISRENNKIKLIQGGKSKSIKERCELFDKLSNNMDGDIIAFDNDQVHTLYSEASGLSALLVTSKCNNKCIMCPQEEFEDNLDSDFVVEVIKLLDKKTTNITLTGGEPTYSTKDFLNILSAIAKYHKSSSIEVLSNGVKLSNDDFVESIHKTAHNPIFWGIPLYGSNPQTHNKIVGTDTFFNTLKGIYNLWKRKYEIEIRFVIMKPSINEIIPLSEFIFRNLPFVSHVAFMGLEMMHSAMINWEKLHTYPDEYVNSLRVALNYLSRREINCSVYNIPLCYLTPDLWTYARKSISPWKRYYYEECASCKMKSECGGVFESNKSLDKKYITPIM